MSPSLPHQPPAPFTFRQCLKLCIPALIVGAILRICFIVAIPEAFNGSDTRSYTQTSDDLWSRGHLSVHQKRRWLYPILLTPAPAIPVLTPAQSIAIVQHLVGLATIVGIGWIVGNVTRFKNIFVPAVTTVMAIWPKMLWFEHEVVAECVFLAAFVLTVGLAFPLGSLRDQKRLFWFLISAAVVAAIKPHGRGIWFGSLVMAAILTRNPLRWNAKCWGAVGLGVLMIFTAGEKRQGNWLLLNSVLPLVDTEAPSYHEYRQALKPYILKAREHLDQWAWVQAKFKKPLSEDDPAKVGPVWAALTTRHDEFSKVCGVLAKGAVLHHPFLVAKFTIMKACLSFVRDDRFAERMDPASFWKKENYEVDSRWPGKPADLWLFYRMDQSQYEKMAAERMQRHNVIAPFERALANGIGFVDDNLNPATHNRYIAFGWLGIASIIGFLFCFTPGRMLSMGFIWLPALLCIATVHAVGDRNEQYVQPVEWTWIVYIAVALDVLLVLATSRSRGKVQTPSAEEVAPV